MNVDNSVKPATRESTVRPTLRPRRAFRAVAGQLRTERSEPAVQRRDAEEVDGRQHRHPAGAEAGDHDVGDCGAAGDDAGQRESAGRRGAQFRDVGQEAGRQEDEEGAGEEQQLRPERHRPHELRALRPVGPFHGAESSSAVPRRTPESLPHPRPGVPEADTTPQADRRGPRLFERKSPSAPAGSGIRSCTVPRRSGESKEDVDAVWSDCPRVARHAPQPRGARARRPDADARHRRRHCHVRDRRRRPPQPAAVSERRPAARGLHPAVGRPTRATTSRPRTCRRCAAQTETFAAVERYGDGRRRADGRRSGVGRHAADLTRPAAGAGRGADPGPPVHGGRSRSRAIASS